MESPLISVVVPIYKVEQYLSHCLESICGQTYGNLEIICVDDGSPDKSIDVLNEFAARDSRIRIIRQTNQGQASARNSALAVAKGDWISFVDGDDWIESNTYESCLSHISDEVDIVVFSPILDWDGDFSETEKNEIRRNYEPYFHSGLNGLTKISDEVILRTDGTVWSKLFRSSLIKEHKLTFPSGRLHEDESFVLRSFLVSRNAYYLPDVRVYHYRQRRGSTMHDARNRGGRPMDYLAVIRDLHKALKESGKVKEHEMLLAQTTDRLLTAAIAGSSPEGKRALMIAGKKLVNEVGVAHHTEMSCIADVSFGLPSPWYVRLFYRRRRTKREWGLFGFMIFAIQNKNGMNVGRLFGIRLWTRTEERGVKN